MRNRFIISAMLAMAIAVPTTVSAFAQGASDNGREAGQGTAAAAQAFGGLGGIVSQISPINCLNQASLGLSANPNC